MVNELVNCAMIMTWPTFIANVCVVCGCFIFLMKKTEVIETLTTFEDSVGRSYIFLFLQYKNLFFGKWNKIAERNFGEALVVLIS